MKRLERDPAHIQHLLDVQIVSRAIPTHPCRVLEARGCLRPLLTLLPPLLLAETDCLLGFDFELRLVGVLGDLLQLAVDLLLLLDDVFELLELLLHASFAELLALDGLAVLLLLD